MVIDVTVNLAKTWFRMARLQFEHLHLAATLADREHENRYLREEVAVARASEGIVGGSRAMRELLALVERVAPTDATVLILGESGTGKELVARSIHERSARARGPFVAVELRRAPARRSSRASSSATSAARSPARSRSSDGPLRARRRRHALPRRDRRALAAGAGEAPARAPGGRVRAASAATRPCASTCASSPRPTATSRAEVAAGRFREDLYYRLNVIAITLPPLRARREDIPLLVEHFVGGYAPRRTGKARLDVARDALERAASPTPGRATCASSRT